MFRILAILIMVSVPALGQSRHRHSHLDGRTGSTSLFHHNVDVARSLLRSNGVTKFVYDPYQGYIPDDEDLVDRRFVFDPYYGYVEIDTDNHRFVSSGERTQFMYSPTYGYIPAPLVPLKYEQYRQKYVFNPLLGYFVPDREDVINDQNNVGVNDLDPEFTYSAKFGYVPDLVDSYGRKLQKYIRNKFFGFIPQPEQKFNVDQNIEFMYHPYYGYIPVPRNDIKRFDQNQRRYVFVPLRGYVLKQHANDFKITNNIDNNDDQVYVYHSYLGYLPIKEGVVYEEPQRYRQDPFLGYVPVQDDYNNLKNERLYIQHPFYGMIPDPDQQQHDFNHRPNLHRNYIREKFVYHPVLKFIPKNEMYSLQNSNPLLSNQHSLAGSASAHLQPNNFRLTNLVDTTLTQGRTLDDLNRHAINRLLHTSTHNRDSDVDDIGIRN